MKFVGLVSGGKDSIYSISEAIKNGHELVACVHLGAPESTDEESYMYQTAASEVLSTLVEECIGVPLLLHQRVGTSLNTSLVYDSTDAQDEVEDLFLALQEAQQRFGVQAVSSGAILSNYQRVRIEHVCNHLGLVSLSYLWRLSDQKDLLQRMMADGIEAVLVQTACPPGLIPHKHLNKSLNTLWMSGLLERMHKQYQFHVCGEGGEYESLVIDAPLYKKRLVLDEVEVVETDPEVGYLRIHKCHAEEKDGGSTLQLHKADQETTEKTENASQPVKEQERPATGGTNAPNSIDTAIQRPVMPAIAYLPRRKCVEGGLWHVSEIVAPLVSASDQNTTEAELAVHEALQIFAAFKDSLCAHGCTAQDVAMVHLYLSEISHFANINKHYRDFFGTLLPPSRSCVAVGKGVLPGGRRVMFDCMIQCGSGLYMRTTAKDVELVEQNDYTKAAHANTTSKLREVLHVQSISHWAPVCVGPYSQVNSIRSGLHFMAGQIGLVPSTMKLRSAWVEQLEQCWKNAAAVMDALDGGSLQDMLSGLIYIADSVYLQQPDAAQKIHSISNNSIEKNGSIVAGRIDSPICEDAYGGYEDEGTWEAMKEKDSRLNGAVCPLLLVSIPEMPMGAKVEVELIKIAKDVRVRLEVNDGSHLMTCEGDTRTLMSNSSKVMWDTGHDFPKTSGDGDHGIALEACARSVAHGCAASAVVTASLLRNHNTVDRQQIYPDQLLSSMLNCMDKALAECRSGLTSQNVMNIRLYYVASKQDDAKCAVPCADGTDLRSALASSVAIWGNQQGNKPAVTIVPVQGIELLPSKHKKAVSFMACHATLLDPVHLETETWIHRERNLLV